MIGAQITLARTGPLISLTRFVALPMVFLWFVEKIKIKRLRAPNPVLAIAFVFFGWTMLSLLWAPDVGLGLAYAKAPLSALFVGWVMWDLAVDAKTRRQICQAVVCAGWLIFAQLADNALKGNDVYTNRAGTATMDPNGAAFYLALILPIAFYIGILDEPYNKFIRFTNLIFPGACFVAIVITASRGGLVALMVAAAGTAFLIPYAFRMPNLRRPLTAAFSLAGVLTLIMMLKIDIKAQVARLLSIATSAKTDQLTGRIPVWKATLHILQHSPIFGVGADGTRYYDANAAIPISPGNVGLVTHNTPLETITCYGIIGFIIFNFLFIRINKDAIQKGYKEKVAILAFTFTFLIGSLSLSSEEAVYFWVITSAYAVVVYFQPMRIKEFNKEELKSKRLGTGRLTPELALSESSVNRV